MECPFCQHVSNDFEDSDEHLIEHLTEYQSEQDQEFGKYTKPWQKIPKVNPIEVNISKWF